METIGIYEAKTNLSKLIGRVERGESFAITKHGKVVAEITPFSEQQKQRPTQLQQALADIAVFREEHPELRMTREEILESCHKGHKY